MNASNTSGMINALQNLDGTPYNPPEEVSSTFPKRNWTQTVTTTQDVTQCSTYYSAAPSNSPVPPSTPSHQSQQPSSSQCDLLEAKAQELQAAWESDVQKAFRKQRLRFDNCALVEDFQGCLTYQCSNGENTIVKPFSPCRNLRAQKIVDHSTQKEYIKYTFDTPTGEHKSVIVDATCSALHRYNLLRDNGFIVFAHLLPTVCGELIARYTAATRDSIPPQIKYSPGWYFSEKHWGFQESEWVDLNTVLLSFTISPTPDVIMYQLVSLYAININFNESSSAYSRDKNYQALMNSMQSNQKHPLYMIVSSNLTPRQRTFCLPIQDFIDPYEATNSIDSIGGLINSIMNNANAFNSTVERSFTKVFDDLGEDCSVQREIAALSMIADVVKWHYSMQVPPQTLSVRCDEYLETYTRYWERINDGNILTPFRNALYAARRSNMICFRSLEDVDISFDCQKEILYDDTYYYTSTALLKRIIKAHLSSYMRPMCSVV